MDSKRVAKCELLAPAGDLDRLKVALHYGADAVYLGAKRFSLRAFADNFTPDQMRAGIAYAHARGKRVYACANIFMKTADEGALTEYLQELAHVGADGVIVTDPGAVWLARRAAPRLPLHLSTQANTLNVAAARFWQEQGVSRLVLARELSLAEIEAIASATTLETEVFVHGAMCVSYSGRCLLSNYVSGRDGNRGECVQACRWGYRLLPPRGEGEALELEQDARGAYLLSSKDLCLIRHLDELKGAGVRSFKIEGRMKGEYYLANVVNAYARTLARLEGGQQPDYEQMERELHKMAHRDYTTLHWAGPCADSIHAASTQEGGSAVFIARVLSCEGGRACVEMRNRFRTGDLVEVLSPGETFLSRFRLPQLQNEQGETITDAKIVQQIVYFETPLELQPGDMLRRIL